MSEEDVCGALSYFHQHSVVICRDHSDPKPDSIIFVSVEWLLLQFMELLSCCFPVSLSFWFCRMYVRYDVLFAVLPCCVCVVYFLVFFMR